MIGSCTMIVKSESRYELHTFGGGLSFFMFLNSCKDDGISPFETISKSVKDWKNAEKNGLTEEEIIEVADATTINEGQPGYSKYAGDGVYLLNLDAGTLSRRDRDKKEWAQL